MKTWFSKTVPYPASDTSKNIDDAFRSLCAAQGGRAKGAAVFSIYDRATHSTTLYFSPEARRIAELQDAASCERPPAPAGLALSIGDPDSWRIHFPTFARPVSQPTLRPLSVPPGGRRRS